MTFTFPFKFLLIYIGKNQISNKCVYLFKNYLKWKEL